MNCSYDICQETPRFVCLCRSPNIYLCQGHSSHHCLVKGPHELQSLYTHLDDSSEKHFIENQLKKYESVAHLMKEISQKASQVIQNILNYRDQVLKLLEKQKNDSILLINSVIRSHEVLTIEYQKYLETEDFDITIEPLNSSKLDSEVEEFFIQDFSIYLKLVPSRQSSEYLKSFVWLEKNSKKVFEFDLLRMESKSFEVNTEEAFGDYAGWCRLPGRKVFYFGGQVNLMYPALSTTFIIDVDCQKVEKRANGLNKKYTVGVCAYQHPFVYVFGGSGFMSSLYSDCEKYDVDENIWTSISSLPFGSDYNCAVVKGSEIMVTGYRLGVLNYNPDKDSYSTLIELNSGCKVLMLEGNTVYLLYGSKVYVKESGDWVMSKKRNLLSEEVVLLSYPVKRGTSFYFLMSDSFLYKFNLVTGALDRLKLLESRDYFWNGF